MEEKYIEIMYECSSENEPVFLGFGIEILESDLSGKTIMEGLESEGLEEAYWENAREFEPGIEKARVLNEKRNGLSFRDALFEVFGHFTVSYEMNGDFKKLDCDVDDRIYSCMEDTSFCALT